MLLTVIVNQSLVIFLSGHNCFFYILKFEAVQLHLEMYTDILPDHLKISIVNLVYKKKETSCMTNYRPVSLLTSFCKVLEVMYNRLCLYMHTNNILEPEQFGLGKVYPLKMQDSS
jgi:hypothetical protein